MMRRITLIAPALAIISIAAVAWRLGSALIAPANTVVRLPPGFSAESVQIPGPNHDIAAWWLDRGSGTSVVLLLHGIRANRLSMVARAQLLSSKGFSVLLIDLQGHGETPGDAITLGWRESGDARAALQWLRAMMPRRSVGVIGVSLGGASTLLGRQPAGFDAVVLEAVYPRIEQAVRNRIHMRLGAAAPILAPLLLLQLEPRLHVSVDDLQPIRSIGLLGAPVLVVGGSADEHTTLPETLELYAAASEPKQLWIVKGARHQDFLAFDPRGYDSEVVGFLSAILKRPPDQTNELPAQAAQSQQLACLTKHDHTGASSYQGGTRWHIAEVAPPRSGGEFEHLGLNTGDRIEAIDGQAVDHPIEWMAALERALAGESVTLMLVRGGKVIEVALDPGAVRREFRDCRSP